jgi:hypothetical protein
MNPSKKIKLGRSGKNGTAKVSTESISEVRAAGTWSLHRGTGYVTRTVFDHDLGREITVYLHRFVLGLRYGDGKVVDHINGDKLDNRLENLRIGTSALNNQNRRRSSGSSKFRGVTKAPSGNWRISVTVPGGKRIRKTFASEIEAAQAADALRQQHQPWSEPDPELIAYRRSFKVAMPLTAKGVKKS